MEIHKYESIRTNVKALEDVRAFEESCREAAALCSKSMSEYARNAETLALVSEFTKKSVEHRNLRDWCSKQIKSPENAGKTQL